MLDRLHLKSFSALRFVGALVLAALGTSQFLATAAAQNLSGRQPLTSNQRPLYRDTMPTGMIGQTQAASRPLLRGYYQATEVTGPAGLQIALAEAGSFTPNEPAPRRAGLQVGCVYRLRLTSIPFYEGSELFPTVEIIDRTYPPAEREHRFPIPIVFDQADMEEALSGNLVTRVVYLEDNEIAEPVSDAGGRQRVYEAAPTEDALRTADRLGRPVAIIRFGSRVPDSLDADLTRFCFGFPHWSPIKGLPNRQRLIDDGLWPSVEVPSSPISRTQGEWQSATSTAPSAATAIERTPSVGRVPIR